MNQTTPSHKTKKKKWTDDKANFSPHACHLFVRRLSGRGS